MEFLLEKLISKFPINPLTGISAPSLAFKIWRTQQLPILNSSLLKVYDFSKSLDNKFRESYLGGIVDVYQPHLQGEGYYYDVNSLYPTAMCKPMPVGIPTKFEITSLEAFLNSLMSGEFFGFVKCTVKASEKEYIGILPIRLNGKLICPGGTFSGFWFSEELLFALKNGYTLLSIKEAFSFQRGVSTFKELINQLNEMKIEAQLNNQPTIRNIAKLLMNSMYGRFGMHSILEKTSIVQSSKVSEFEREFSIQKEIRFEDKSLISYTIENLQMLGNERLPLKFKVFMDSLPGRTNVAIASAVTAYSRMLINQAKLLVKSRLYLNHKLTLHL